MFLILEDHPFFNIPTEENYNFIQVKKMKICRVKNRLIILFFEKKMHTQKKMTRQNH